MKIKIIAETFICGKVVKAGEVIEADKAVASTLIENYKAETVSNIADAEGSEPKTEGKQKKQKGGIKNGKDN